MIVPKWLKELPQSEGFLAKPLTPSHQDESNVCAVSPLMENNDGKLYARGKLIHKMLQFLPMIEPEKRESRVDMFLCKQCHELDDKEKLVAFHLLRELHVRHGGQRIV